ncbi:GNAT family N-acetyltransferase [Psychrobacillus psychrodurans]|jgi:GNAT superfamily N-acetyltransferase|uniref:GNAT family N-acetyltransferase n=1 Tax=Psychrobacillus psychrodurans TaxID=126157 RepID=UPI0008ECDC70|nr:GNAT family N-acetyltransferase [Psychrobacillus psychrodurans]MCZ8542440.1 GNAT family N-acetyltransferase [Psychrobacillus psychrodurans]SFN22876.1 Acetyltransferase (GNAT) domain-containing protein [Psychrobacillus psychrodurans]
MKKYENVDIRRPRTEDMKEFNQFFRTVITDTFIKEGIGDKLQDIEDEIEAKKTYLESDFVSDGEKRYFLIALDRDKIIGSIEYGPASELISNCTDNALKDLNEVGTVFVHPDFQSKGVGNLLLNKMYLTLQSKGIEEFCLDSGYISAQKIWKKKFGNPNYLLKDYWDEGFHHMIWRVKVDDLLK